MPRVCGRVGTREDRRSACDGECSNSHLNSYNTADTNQMLNRAIGYCYEPGSTFKMATVASAIDAGVVRADTVIDCEMGVWIHMGKALRDFHPHGQLRVADVIKYSSNIGAAKIALMLGQERLHAFLENFHIGCRAGIKLPGEEAGLLHALKRWNALSITHVAMGHEVMVTSIQILGVLNAIANDGLLVRPRMVDKIVTSDGSVSYKSQTEMLGRPIRPETARLMRKLLTRVTKKAEQDRGPFSTVTPSAGRPGRHKKFFQTVIIRTPQTSLPSAA